MAEPLALLVTALALVVAPVGCGASDSETAAESTTAEYDVASGDANQVPDEIKEDVETLAEAFVRDSAKYEDLFPPEYIAIPPGRSLTDNEEAKFAAAIVSLDQEELMPTFQRLGAYCNGSANDHTNFLRPLFTGDCPVLAYVAWSIWQALETG